MDSVDRTSRPAAPLAGDDGEGLGREMGGRMFDGDAETAAA